MVRTSQAIIYTLENVYRDCINVRTVVADITNSRMIWHVPVSFTVEPLYWGHFYLHFSPCYRGFLNSEVICYTTVLDWDKNGVFSIEVSAIQRFVIERLHCTG